MNPFSYDYAEPLWFFGLLLIIPMIWKHFSGSAKGSIALSTLSAFSSQMNIPSFMKYHLLFFLRLIAIIFALIAMARPQSGKGEVKERTEGLDIILTIDTSESMKGLDFILDGQRKTRLDVVKNVLINFIDKRIDDRLGMVVFGTNAFTQAPLTLDHDVLLRFLDATEIGMAGGQTAIGDAMGVAINRLKDLESKSKIVILLTDGSNTAGEINPLEMIKAAKLKNIKIYTIGVGSKGDVPVQTRYGIKYTRMDLDEGLLQKIAEETGGKYYRAKDTEGLKQIYENIDSLEKTKKEVQIFHNYKEHYHYFLWSSLAFFLLEILLSLTGLRRIP